MGAQTGDSSLAMIMVQGRDAKALGPHKLNGMEKGWGFQERSGNNTASISERGEKAKTIIRKLSRPKSHPEKENVEMQGGSESMVT